MPSSGRSLRASLVLTVLVAGCDLRPPEAKALIERELERPVKTFCCTYIDSPTARATCENEAEARCGYAANAHVVLGELEKHGHGDVVQVSFGIEGPRGRGRGWAQFLGHRGWHVSELLIVQPPAPPPAK